MVSDDVDILFVSPVLLPPLEVSLHLRSLAPLMSEVVPKLINAYMILLIASDRCVFYV